MYSLGIIIHEVLTETLGSLDEHRATPRGRSDHAPKQAPRFHHQHSCEDLKAIVRKAIHEEKGQRYESASCLSEDLGRFLRNEPVSAKKHTWRYLAAKFLGRHVNALFMLLVLVAATCIAFYYWHRSSEAESQTTLAQKKIELVNQLTPWTADFEQHEIELKQTATDLYPTLELPIQQISLGDTLVVSREVVHGPANPYFRAFLWIQPEGRADLRFGVLYSDYSNWGPTDVRELGSSDFSCPVSGIFLLRKEDANFACEFETANRSAVVDGRWHQWVSETIVYETNSGDLHYYVDGHQQLCFHVGQLPRSSNFVSIKAGLRGWWTGHSLRIRDLRIHVEPGGVDGAVPR